MCQRGIKYSSSKKKLADQFVRARSTWQKGTGNTDTNFLSNATGNGDRKCIWQKDSVCVTGTFLSSAGRARVT